MSGVYTNAIRQAKKPAGYRVDFWAWNMFFICMTAGMFLAYWFIVAQASGSPELILYTTNFIIFMILLVGAASMLMVLWALGAVSFDYNVMNLREMGSTILYGVAFAGFISLVTFPIVSYYGQNLSSMPGNALLIPTLIAPGGEEFWSNGGIYGFTDMVLTRAGFGDGFGPFMIKGGVRATSFTISHFWAYTLTAGTFLFIFAAGYVLAFSFWYTKRLGVPVVSHLTWNGIMLHLGGLI